MKTVMRMNPHFITVISGLLRNASHATYGTEKAVSTNHPIRVMSMTAGPVT